ncbi:hypothetical protein BC830DRAFT_440033 [Chytriomyces sp. MP71]|nr:hypothetical protein BC830DRAFT_440033 [Chytriomyces sp. MP71]
MFPVWSGVRALFLIVDSTLAVLSMIDRTQLWHTSAATGTVTDSDTIMAVDTTKSDKASNAKNKSKKAAKKRGAKLPADVTDPAPLSALEASPALQTTESLLAGFFARNLWLQLLLAAGLLALTALQCFDMLLLRPDLLDAGWSFSQGRIAGLCLTLLGLRLWAMSSLGCDFTFTIHKRPLTLVETGPYLYLAHPSYTGIIFWAFFRFSFLVDRSGPVLPILARLQEDGGLEVLLKVIVADPEDISAWFDLMWGASVVSMGITALLLPFSLLRRIRHEEEFLAATFGAEKYNAFRDKRWKLIPFVW